MRSTHEYWIGAERPNGAPDFSAHRHPGNFIAKGKPSSSHDGIFKQVNMRTGARIFKETPLEICIRSLQRK
jgi:hypothetical protein